MTFDQEKFTHIFQFDLQSWQYPQFSYRVYKKCALAGSENFMNKKIRNIVTKIKQYVYLTVHIKSLICHGLTE